MGYFESGRIAVGSQAGRKVFTLQTLPACEPDEFAGTAGKISGFSLHAGVAARADERKKLERLCRYISRPAVSEKRLSLTPAGNIRYQLKTPYRDGTNHVNFEPLDFIARLAALIPKPRVSITRFHVVKALNQAVDEVRKDEWRALDTGGRKAIKGLRWLLSMHSRNRSKGNTRFLNSLRNSNRRIHRAWVLKDEFEHIWNYRYRACAEKFLKRWMTAALRSRIPSLRQFVGTLRNHFDNIVAFTDRNLTNAVGEGLNRIVKIVKNRASGYRNLDSFADMIFLTIGDLDIPAQIPSHLRTL